MSRSQFPSQKITEWAFKQLNLEVYNKKNKIKQGQQFDLLVLYDIYSHQIFDISEH